MGLNKGTISKRELLLSAINDAVNVDGAGDDDYNNDDDKHDVDHSNSDV